MNEKILGLSVDKLREGIQKAGWLFGGEISNGLKWFEKPVVHIEHVFLHNLIGRIRHTIRVILRRVPPVPFVGRRRKIED